MQISPKQKMSISSVIDKDDSKSCNVISVMLSLKLVMVGKRRSCQESRNASICNWFYCLFYGNRAVIKLNIRRGIPGYLPLLAYVREGPR